MAVRNDKIQSLIAGATSGTALYHYGAGFGLDKEVVGHVAPWVSFFVGWIWIVLYQEIFSRIDVYRIKKACERRMAEIRNTLESTAHLSDERRRKLEKELDDCIDIISKASSDDLKRRLATVMAR